ncbi:hypothetical protein MPSYJ_12860 [Mycolicibacterium psychrotolerans]|uniref:Uncharacterized protein n=1 Tax=Mycolicibacterium psychrotolerans TaxID=216929 RepID=A0A7I7M6M1_9MYCO|nr:hypothetical protein MPSYJ_12860 [Mycolicibacterium psychrotolerans]
MGDAGADDAPTGIAPTELGEAIDETEAHTAWSLDDTRDEPQRRSRWIVACAMAAAAVAVAISASSSRRVAAVPLSDRNGYARRSLALVNLWMCEIAAAVFCGECRFCSSAQLA